ncbi:hypothetical protein F5Y06DRAFT_293583 [Hypoxylon sp. FL0890]|nr:hypothetical protein F5Y06DRAFT_293583 [Hypoxylon sp. FL0890]
MSLSKPELEQKLSARNSTFLTAAYNIWIAGKQRRDAAQNLDDDPEIFRIASENVKVALENLILADDSVAVAARDLSSAPTPKPTCLLVTLPVSAKKLRDEKERAEAEWLRKGAMNSRGTKRVREATDDDEDDTPPHKRSRKN